jgi:hypothetical protein
MPDDPATRTPAENAPRASVADRRRQERRLFQRFPFNADVEVLEPQSGTKISGRVTDLSLGGCYVDTLSPFSASTTVQIRIVRGPHSFEAQAKVTSSTVGLGMGLAFVAAQPEQKRLLGSWIVEMGGKLPRLQRQGNGDAAGVASDGETSTVLTELVHVLMRKGVLSETVGQEILKKMHR